MNLKPFRMKSVGPGMLLFFLIASLIAAAQYADPPGIQWQDRREIDRGDAYQGPWQMNDSEFHFVDDPDIALSDNGDAGMVWVDQEAQEVLFQYFDSENHPRFDEPVNVSQSPEIFSWLPRIIVHPDNPERIYVLWQDIVFSGGSHGGEIFFSKSEDGGRNFPEPINLSKTENGAGKGRLTQRRWDNGSLDLAIGPEGTIYTAWTEYEGDLRLSRSTDGGEQFSEPLELASNSEAGPARGPALATGNNGTVYLAWSVGEDPTADIHYSYSTDRGATFAEPQQVANTSGHADAPRLAIDHEDILHLVYGESSEGPLRRYDIHYTRLEEPGDDFEQPKAIVTPDQITESVNYPAIAIDRRNNLYVLWERYPDDTIDSRGLGFTVSGDGGRSFDSPNIIPDSGLPEFGNNGSRQGSLMKKLSVNAEGELAVVNSTFNSGDASYIWMWRGTAE